MMLALAIAVSFVAFLSWGANSQLTPLALDALSGRRVRLWRAACWAATLRFWIVAGLAVAWLGVLVVRGPLDSPVGTGVLVGLAVGVLGSATYERARNHREHYWDAIHDSLEDAVRDGNSAQRRLFNLRHRRLCSGPANDRETVLEQILTAT